MAFTFGAPSALLGGPSSQPGVTKNALDVDEMLNIVAADGVTLFEGPNPGRINDSSPAQIPQSSSIDHSQPEAELDSNISFKPIGLLPESQELDSGMVFNPNGLLSESRDHAPMASEIFDTPLNEPLFKPSGLLPGSQDELPSLSQAFGPFSESLLDHSMVNSNFSAPFVPRYSVRATTFDGKTIYIKKRNKAIRDTRNNASFSNEGRSIGKLLDMPIHRMMDQLSANTAARLQQYEQNAVAERVETNKTFEDTLWVDRYRPQRFTELMGNERIARETMAWVKQWDSCVFGKTRGKKRTRDADENDHEEDPYHRPQEKILLLSGPPGLGKTTLAHVVARQAGYEVMEINASDARSGQIVDDRIRPALESGSAVGSSKPVLLIIDEIDGATGAGENSNTFIHKLVQLTQEKPKKKQRKGSKRDPNTKRPILRPIICICNDQNASSLVKLRPIAFQVRFARPADIHTVRRLKEVCELEGLKADSRALTTLVGVAKGDLRGCLNTLQFIKSRNEEVTESIIRKATTGMKEADTSLLSVLNNLFTPLTKKRLKELAMSEDEEAKYVARLSQEVGGSGRESSIASGCFAHYATLRRHDSNFTRYEKANEWLATYDYFSASMYSEGEFALNQYLPYTLVPFYPLFQERGAPRVERNQTDWEMTQLIRRNEEIYKSLARCLNSATVNHGGDYRHLVSTPTLQLEFSPFINRIISPPLKPINSQVIRPGERALLKRLVDIMSSLELRFIQERAEDGQLSYRLDPPIDVFITYDGKRAADIAVSRFAVRHLVAQEIDERMMSKEEIIEKGMRGKHSSSRTSEFDSKSRLFAQSTGSKDASSGPPNKRSKTASINVDIADKPPTDFFGRAITIVSASSTKSAARKNVEKKYRVSYRYTEGNSAAVRKPVKVSTFL